jgi:2-alkyl-3-oxoalkanoate reductase
MKSILVTGGTGFVGSHVVEWLHREGKRVSTLARPTSDTTLLRGWGTEIIPGDLQDTATVATAVNNCEAVIHTAAKVGDWGEVEAYRKVNFVGLKNLLEACRVAKVSKFIHVSSLGVYEARHHYQTDESVLLPAQHIDGYTQSKVEAERLIEEYRTRYEMPITILRPGFIYGPRDRNVLPTIIENLKQGKVKWIAGGKYALNTTYVGNLVEAIRLAMNNPKAAGQTYNITDGEFVSKRRFFETIYQSLQLPAPKGNVTLWLARIVAKVMESQARKRKAPTPPRLTQARLKFLGLNLDFSIAKARTELGYNPPTSFQDGMRITLESLTRATS